MICYNFVSLSKRHSKLQIICFTSNMGHISDHEYILFFLGLIQTRVVISVCVLLLWESFKYSPPPLKKNPRKINR